MKKVKETCAMALGAVALFIAGALVGSKRASTIQSQASPSVEMLTKYRRYYYWSEKVIYDLSNLVENFEDVYMEGDTYYEYHEAKVELYLLN